MAGGWRMTRAGGHGYCRFRTGRQQREAASDAKHDATPAERARGLARALYFLHYTARHLLSGPAVLNFPAFHKANGGRAFVALLWDAGFGQQSC